MENKGKEAAESLLGFQKHVAGDCRGCLLLFVLFAFSKSGGGSMCHVLVHVPQDYVSNFFDSGLYPDGALSVFFIEIYD